MTTVSIIIPVYCKTDESLTWLRECVESAVLQDCEVVVVDDGSPLDIKKALEGMNIKRVSSVHVGVSEARNIAARYATGDLIFPLDCDDRLVPGAISKLLLYWDGKTPVYPDVRKFGLENVDHYKLPEFTCEHIYDHVGFTSVNVLHLRDQWKSLGGWDPTIEFYEDGDRQIYDWLDGVSPSYRRKGIASRLMNMGRDFAKNQGYAKIKLKTREKPIREYNVY